MAFPTVVTRSTYAGDSTVNVTHGSVTLPASIVAGNLLVMIFVFSGTGVTFNPVPAGWTQVSNQSAFSASSSVIYKVASGSEGATMSVTISSAVRIAAVGYQISSYSGTPEAAINAPGTSTTNPNPPSLTPSWGALSNLYIAAYCAPITSANTGIPTNYSNGQQAAAGSGVSCGSAERQIAGSPEDPGTFTLSISTWNAYTIVVKPIVAAGGKLFRPPSMDGVGTGGPFFRDPLAGKGFERRLGA